MRVSYMLASTDLMGIAAEASRAEALGYDTVSAADNAHAPFLMLALAANATSRGNWPAPNQWARYVRL